MIRCELDCGHTAFALPHEARQVARRFFWCHAHVRYERILSAQPLEQAPRSTARLLRHTKRRRTKT